MRKTMKSASGKRPPDKAHNTPEKKLSSRISSDGSVRFCTCFSLLSVNYAKILVSSHPAEKTQQRVHQSSA